MGKTKGLSRTRAIQLYPRAPLGRKKDHALAEAILIARYGLERTSEGRAAFSTVRR